MTRLPRILSAILLLGLTQSALAEKVADITRMYKARTNVLTGMGLVVGLKGTGDGGAYLPTMKMLAQLQNKYANPTSVADLGNAGNVAIVQVMATIPAEGVRNGDKLNVHVMSIGGATSLRNGTLYMTSMVGPDGQPYTPVDSQGRQLRPVPYALASGTLDVDDITAPTSGVVRGGAQMEVDLLPKCIDNAGRFTLVIDGPSASYAMASTIAKLVNETSDTGETLAIAVDSKNVVVQIPESERSDPVAFISRVLQLPIPQQIDSEARVRINDKNGTIIITGDVEISPSVICCRGLTISTLNPAPVPTARNPQVIVKQAIPLDTTNQGGARLQDLASAFDQLKVPIDDRIYIIKELYSTGKLHAKLTIDDQEQ